MGRGIAALAGLLAALCAAPLASAPSVRASIILQTGHSGMINAVAWSPDSKFVVSGGQDNAILLWNLAGQIVVRAALPPLPDDMGQSPILHIAVAPDGTITADALAAKGANRVEGRQGPVLAYHYLWRPGGPVTLTKTPLPPDLKQLSSDKMDTLILVGTTNTEAMKPPQPSPDRLYTVRWVDTLPVIVRLDGSRPPVALSGQSGLGDSALAQLAGGTAPVDPADLRGLQERSNEMALFSTESNAPWFILGPGGRTAAWTELQAPTDQAIGMVSVASFLRAFDLERGVYAPTLALVGDYDRVSWFDDTTLFIAGSDNAAAPIVYSAADLHMLRKAPAMCLATALGRGGILVGAGTANCKVPDCYPADGRGGIDKTDAADHARCDAELAAGPVQGLWLFAPDGKRRALDTNGFASAQTGDTADYRGRDDLADAFGEITASPDGAFVAATHVAGKRFSLGLWDAADGRLIAHIEDAGLARFDGRGHVYVVTAKGRIAGYEARTGTPLPGPTFAAAGDFAVGEDGGVIGISDAVGTLRLMTIASGAPIGTIAIEPGAHWAFALGGSVIWSGRSDKSVTFWRVADQRALFTLYNLPDSRFIAATAEGRYDSNLPADTRAVRWSMSDQPKQSLASQTFMRDYYEPGLIGRLLDCTEQGGNACTAAFAPVPDLASLDRILPKVAIVRVAPGSAPDTMAVTVEATPVIDRAAPNGRTRSGLHDLRLFRDGKLVAEWGAPPGDLAEADRAGWRTATMLAPDDATAPVRHIFADVPLASTGSQATFAAYAFNADRVKSETASLKAPLPARPPRQPRLYLLTIGIDGYGAGGFPSLRYAVADAKSMADTLARLVPRRGGTYEVQAESVLGTAQDPATKAKLRAAFAHLRDARPDDAVVITYAGHGFTDAQGRFALVPADVTRSGDVPDRASLITAEELTEWLGPVDAGEIAFVIDACHSAASVSAGGFKPGPMGDPGLGQLAYDKGIRILAASQPDEVALELSSVGHGALTYALVQQGAAEGKADLDHDGFIRLDELLRYAAGAVQAVDASAADGESALVVNWGRDARYARQKPALFDYVGQPAGVGVPLKALSPSGVFGRFGDHPGDDRSAEQVGRGGVRPN